MSKKISFPSWYISCKVGKHSPFTIPQNLADEFGLEILTARNWLADPGSRHVKSSSTETPQRRDKA